MKSTMKNMLLSLTLIAAALGAVLAWVHQLTEEPIRQAQVRARLDALAAVLPAFDNDPAAAPDTITVAGEERPVVLFPATNDGKPCGVAVETWTNDGFSGEITIMVGFDMAGAITGYTVLSHAETPGLGAKADDWFRQPQHTIIGTDHALSLGDDVDAITAATITSRAVIQAVNRARQAFNQYIEKQ